MTKEFKTKTLQLLYYESEKIFLNNCFCIIKVFLYAAFGKNNFFYIIINICYIIYNNLI